MLMKVTVAAALVSVKCVSYINRWYTSTCLVDSLKYLFINEQRINKLTLYLLTTKRILSYCHLLGSHTHPFVQFLC
jgi:hypothetical protein